MQIIVDRIEGNKVVVELPDKTTVGVPISLFPEALEGDIYHITKDTNQAALSKVKIQNKFNRLKRE